MTQQPLPTSADDAGTPRARRGRPRVSSREVLEDAAYELFIENGYAKTTVDHITQRAGVSRGTFFNYFAAKGDVFWGQVDESLAHLGECLAASDPQLPVVRAIGEAFADAAEGFGPGNVPWILTQHQLIGSRDEVQASALTRFTAQADTLRSFAAARLGVDPTDPLPRVIAYTTISAVIAAAQSWAAAGSSRGHLAPYLLRALAPVADGFEGSTVIR